jgi:hypothetical protein
LLRENHGGLEIDRLQRDRKRLKQRKSFEQRLPLGGGTAIFFKHAFAISYPMKLGARRVASRSRETILSRVSSLNSNATIADASTTLSVTIFSDQPRRVVPPHEIEPAHSSDDFVNCELARRPGRLIDQRPQFALRRPMVGLDAFAQPSHLLLRHALDRKVRNPPKIAL